MSLHRIPAHGVVPQPWRNGGGQTRELWAWPADPASPSDSWRLRISLADITQDGPFSPFPGVARCFTVVSGAGVTLGFADRSLALRPGDTPLRFDGAAAPSCHLLGGPTQDLNLMVRGGTGQMQAIAAGEAVPCPAGVGAGAGAGIQWGLYVTVPGQLHIGTGTNTGPAQAPAQPGSGQVLDLPGHTLLWDDQPAPGSLWRFTPAAGHGAPLGWWLGYTPEGRTA